jgi:hypothetical protein
VRLAWFENHPWYNETYLELGPAVFLDGSYVLTPGWADEEAGVVAMLAHGPCAACGGHCRNHHVCEAEVHEVRGEVEILFGVNPYDHPPPTGLVCYWWAPTKRVQTEPHRPPPRE